MVKMTQDEIQAVARAVHGELSHIDVMKYLDMPDDTADRVALVAIAALDAARGDPVARVIEWLRKDADQTEIEAGHIVKNSSGNPRKNAAEWAMLVAMKRGLADAIERGEPFNG